MYDPEITKSVKKIFNKNALDFPYYVDDIDNKITNKKLNGFYIGGTLNEYRKLFLGKKGKYIIDSYHVIEAPIFSDHLPIICDLIYPW